MPPRPPRKSHKRLIIGLVIGLLIGGVVLSGLILFAVDKVLTHDLVEADFNQSADPFETGTFGTGGYELVDGTYQITALEDFQPNYEPLGSFAGFARVAYAFDLGVDVVAVDGLGSGTGVGIGCVEQGPGSTRAEEASYLFIAGGGGNPGSAILHLDPAATEAEWDQNVIANGTEGIGPGDRIELNCATDLLDDNKVKLTASVNGVEVLEGSHDAGRSVEGFDAMELVFVATEPGQQVRFDNAVAHVPE